MIQQTVAAAAAAGLAEKFWIITNEDLAPAIAKQLPSCRKHKLLRSPWDGIRLPPLGWRHFCCCGRIRRL